MVPDILPGENTRLPVGKYSSIFNFCSYLYGQELTADRNVFTVRLTMKKKLKIKNSNMNNTSPLHTKCHLSPNLGIMFFSYCIVCISMFFFVFATMLLGE